MHWVWCALELHRSAFSSMDTRWNLTDWDIMELILELDSNTHLSEDEGICVQTGSGTVDTDTCITQWSDNTNCQHTVLLAYKFMGDSSGLQRTVSPGIKYCCPLSVFMLFFFEVIQLLMVERHFISSTSTHWTKDCPHCLAGLFRKFVCFWWLLCRWGTIRGTRREITGWR
jgi:hypothetical protein